MSLIDKKQQQFKLPNNRDDYSWLGAYADVVRAAIGIPYTEYKIKPWVWKHLKTHSSVLELDKTGENKTAPRA